MEMVVENLEDAAVGSVARQSQRGNESSDPVLGDREVEERDVAAGLLPGGRESSIESLLGSVDLGVDEPAADVVLSGHCAQGLTATHGLERKLLALGRVHSSGGRGLGLNKRSLIADNADSHACSLHFSSDKSQHHCCYRQMTGMAFTGSHSAVDKDVAGRPWAINVRGGRLCNQLAAPPGSKPGVTRF
jgi:hypothetical protein